MTTLKTFLQQTAPTPAADLRRAMTVALSTEKPRSRESYARFYKRVMDELAATTSETTSDSDGAIIIGSAAHSVGSAAHLRFTRVAHCCC